MKQINPGTRVGLIIGAFLFLLTATSSSGWAKPNRDRHRMMEKIETIKMWKLMDALKLDTETALKVFPIIKEMDREKALLMQKKRGLIRQLQKKLNEKEVPKGEVSALASQIFDLTEKLCATSRETYNKLKSVLTEKQLGQYLLFQQRFRRELLHRWFREDRGAAKRGRKPRMKNGPTGQPPQQ